MGCSLNIKPVRFDFHGVFVQENQSKRQPRLLPPVVHLPPELPELQGSPRLLGAGRQHRQHRPKKVGAPMAPMRHGRVELKLGSKDSVGVICCHHCVV